MVSFSFVKPVILSLQTVELAPMQINILCFVVILQLSSVHGFLCAEFCFFSFLVVSPRGFEKIN